MEGTLKADKHFVAFAFDRLVEDMVNFGDYLFLEHAPERGYVWAMGFINNVSYMIDIMPMDEARHMYE